MSDYSVVGNAVRNTLLADSWIADPANVKTVETYSRGYSLRESEESQYFGPEEAPAIAVIPNPASRKGHAISASRLLEQVNVEVVAVTFHREAQTGMAVQHQFVGNIERVLENQKTAGKDLGIGAFVDGLGTADRTTKNGELFCLVSTIRFQIEQVISIHD